MTSDPLLGTFDPEFAGLLAAQLVNLGHPETAKQVPFLEVRDFCPCGGCMTFKSQYFGREGDGEEVELARPLYGSVYLVDGFVVEVEVPPGGMEGYYYVDEDGEDGDAADEDWWGFEP